MPPPFTEFKIHPTIPPVAYRSIRVIQREYEHDRAVVTLDRIPRAEGRPSGDQMLVRWGEVPQRSEVFCGYLNHDEGNFNLNNEQMKMVCVGASLPYKQERTRAWMDTTLQRIVREIARQERFDSYVLGSDIVSSEVQQGESDWAFLARVSKERGKTFFARNTCLFLGPRGDFFSQNLPTSPTFVSGSTLREFKPLTGELLPGNDRRRTQMFGLGKNGSVFRVSEDRNNREALDRTEPMFESVQTIAVDNQKEAKQRLPVDDFTNRAEALTMGDARVRPGKTVSLRGLDNRYEGFWYVTGVTHRLTGGSYLMDLELARPDTVVDSRGLGPGLKVVKAPGFDPYVPAPTRDLNGRWRAEWGS